MSKTAQMYSHTALEVTHLNWVSEAEIQVVSRAVFFLEALGENCCLF